MINDISVNFMLFFNVFFSFLEQAVFQLGADSHLIARFPFGLHFVNESRVASFPQFIPHFSCIFSCSKRTNLQRKGLDRFFMNFFRVSLKSLSLARFNLF